MKAAGKTLHPLPEASSPASPETDAVASLWVVRQRAGLDPADARELAAWIAADPRHEEAFSRLSAMAGVFQRARAAGTTGSIVSQLTLRARRRRVRRKALAASGAMALAAIFGLFWLRPTIVSPPTSSADAAHAFEAIRRLPDGSLVELKEGADIAVKYEAGARRVELLRGEALFQVQQDAARPFLVRASGVEVKAVGTAFHVQVAQSAVVVVVTEGRVRVDDAARGQSLLPAPSTEGAPVLNAGQKVTVAVAPSGAVLPSPEIVQVGPEEIERNLSWRISRLEFEGEELARAVEQMNRQNRLQIVVGDDSIRRLRVSGVFLSHDPQTFVRLISATFDLRPESRGANEIVLRRK